MKIALAMGLLLAAGTARAAAVARYNEPVAAGRPTALEARVEALAADVARKQRRQVPRADARLHAAADEIARLLPAEGPPGNELVQGALWVHGIVEPAPHLWLSEMSPGGEEALLHDLARDLPRMLAQGRFARVAVGTAARRDAVRVVVLLQESFVELAPVERAPALGATVALRGRLADGYVKPEAFVTTPDGKLLTRMALGGDAGRFDASFRCGPERGRYQVEVTGEDRFGSTVLANFPIWCGERAPDSAAGAAPPGGRDESAATPGEAEQTIWRLVNADRARAKLPPLAWDDGLAAVARKHSADMQAHGFFGHISPTNGSPADRVKRARLDVMLILENVARALTPGEAERGLMNSPDHRANLLNPDVTRIGVGVVFDEDKGLFVTQLFARPPEAFHPGTVDEVRRQVTELRRARHVRPLARDPGLEALAQATVREMAQRGLSSKDAARRIEEALGHEGARWQSVRTLFAVVSAASQVGHSLEAQLSDPAVTDVGVGVEPGKRPDGTSALYVIIILAARR